MKSSVISFFKCLFHSPFDISICHKFTFFSFSTPTGINNYTLLNEFIFFNYIFPGHLPQILAAETSYEKFFIQILIQEFLGILPSCYPAKSRGKMRSYDESRGVRQVSSRTL